MSWITIRNYGFSDATEIFIFISGYTAAFVYGRAMRERGFVVAGARILTAPGRSMWPISSCSPIYMAEISYVATSFENPLYAEEMNILDFLKQPDQTIVQALLLKFKPANMDVLPLYIVLLPVFPLLLWVSAAGTDTGARRARPPSTSLALQFGWNLPAYPEGRWYFNPFAWQLLFVFGAWCAIGGAVRLARIHALADHAVARGRLSAVCLRDRADLVLARATWTSMPLWCRGPDVPDRQDQSRRVALCAFPGAWRC